MTFASINTLNGVVSRVRRDNSALVCLGSQEVRVVEGVEADELTAAVGSSKQASVGISSVPIIPSFIIDCIRQATPNSSPRSARSAFVYMCVALWLTVDTCRA